MTKEELAAKLGKNMKITSTRLGELIKQGMVTKTEEGNHKITTIGFKSLQRYVLPRIRAKAGCELDCARVARNPCLEQADGRRDHWKANTQS